MTQLEWTCELCGASGCIEHTDRGAHTMWALFARVSDQHHQASPTCRAKSREMMVRLPMMTFDEQFPVCD